MLVFGTALTLVTAIFTLTGSLGWLPVTGLAIAVLIVGFRLRRLLDSLTTMMRPGAGSIMLGGLARRGAMSAVRRVMGALSSRGAAPVPAERGRVRTSESSPQRVSSVRVYRQAPVVGSAIRGSAAGSPYELTAGPERRRADGAGASPDGNRPGGLHGAAAAAGGTGAGLAAGAGPARSTAAINLARARSQAKDGERRRTIVLGASGSAPSAKAAASGGSRGSVAAQKARYSRRPIPAPSSEVRYEPRIHTHSASLREGPPKGQRARRKATAAQPRRFRDYSAVAKDGVTLHVPTRR
jgi:hypothetical protein